MHSIEGKITTIRVAIANIISAFVEWNRLDQCHFVLNLYWAIKWSSFFSLYDDISFKQIISKTLNEQSTQWINFFCISFVRICFEKTPIKSTVQPLQVQTEQHTNRLRCCFTLIHLVARCKIFKYSVPSIFPNSLCLVAAAATDVVAVSGACMCMSLSLSVCVWTTPNKTSIKTIDIQ